MATLPSFHELTERLKSSLATSHPESVRDFAMSKDGEKLLLQWKLLANLRKRSPDIDSLNNLPYNSHLKWLLNDLSALEMLLCSGYVQEQKWLEALEILGKILSMYPEAREGLKLRLAVAVSLTFSTPVKSLADHNVAIDALKRFEAFVSWEDKGQLFSAFKDLTTWQMRYVVGSWAQDDELLWARDNVPEEFRKPNKIGEATHAMMKYKEINEDGTSVQDGAKYYGNQPVTMALLHEVGAVCGGISKFGCAMSQAFGIPAMPVGQPGHCAFLWWNEGQWTLSNDNAGLGKSVIHDGIQWTWDKNAEYVILMEQAQQKFDRYVQSEKLRIAAKFFSQCVRLELLDSATSYCVTNFSIWRDFSKVLAGSSVDFNCSNWILKHAKCTKSGILSKNKNVRVSDFQERGPNIVDGTGSEWWSNKETAWIDIDLDGDCSVTGVEIQWWGTSVSGCYIVYAAQEDGEYKEVLSKTDEKESPEGYNSWSRLGGWKMKTSKVKILLMNGSLDPWGFGYWFGIRQVLILGKKENQIVLSLNKNVSVSECEERAQNLTDGSASEWWAECKEAWVEIDLEQIFYVDQLNLQWWGNSVAKEIAVLASTDGKKFQCKQFIEVGNISELNSWTNISVNLVASAVRLELKNGTLDQWGMKKNFGLRNLVILGEKASIKELLIDKAKRQLTSWPVVEKDVCKMIFEADLQVVSEMAKCKVSDCPERAQNITDGTQSEWWSESQEAWVEIKLSCECKIHEVKIQWWGTSVSKDLKVHVASENGEFCQVKTTADEVESPNGYNSWSVFTGWGMRTARKLKFELKDGSLDPWGMGKYFGIRQIIITGLYCI